MQYGKDYHYVPVTNVKSGKVTPVRSNVTMLTTQISNVIFIGTLGIDGYVIVDTGMPHQAEEVIQTAKDLYGSSSKPRAIILKKESTF